MKLRAGLLKKTKLTNFQPNSHTKRGDITTDTTEIQRIRDYYKHLYTSKLENLKEIDNFLETYNLPRLNHGEIENLNRLITNKENESLTKNLSPKKSRIRWLHF